MEWCKEGSYFRPPATAAADSSMDVTVMETSDMEIEEHDYEYDLVVIGGR